MFATIGSPDPDPRSVNNPFQQRTDLPPGMFVGREAQLGVVMQRLANRESTAVCGRSHMGKTSLLKQIVHPEVTRAWGLGRSHIFLLLDCIQFDPWASDDFWRTVFERLSDLDLDAALEEQVGKVLTGGTVAVPDINGLIDVLGKQDRMLTLLLDNFDRVIGQIESCNPPFLNLMRTFLGRPSKGFAVVVTSEQPLEDLCAKIEFVDVSPFQDVFMAVSLAALSPDDVNRLIDSRLEGTGITFSPHERMNLYKTSEGNPGKLMSSCYTLFEQCAQAGNPGNH